MHPASLLGSLEYGDVLGFCSGGGNLGLLLAVPGEWSSIQEVDISTNRYPVCRIGEVGICVTEGGCAQGLFSILQLKILGPRDVVEQMVECCLVVG